VSTKRWLSEYAQFFKRKGSSMIVRESITLKGELSILAPKKGILMKKSFLLSLFIGFLLISGCSYQAPYQPVGVPFNISSSENLSLKPPRNFTEAKKEAWKIFADHPESFYCKCPFTPQGEILPATCSYAPTKITSRTYKVEWEHIVPAKILGENLTCWKKNICTKQDGTKYKGRACCSKVDKTFQRMEADLHNLVPAIGAINQARGTYSFGLVEGEVEDFMGCPLKISRTEKKVEPRPEIRGLIARAYLYMSTQYDISLSPSERNLYEEWDQEYLPDPWEIEWNEKVSQIQGNRNFCISH
jgi:deoxyribonuclease-1